MEIKWIALAIVGYLAVGWATCSLAWRVRMISESDHDMASLACWFLWPMMLPLTILYICRSRKKPNWTPRVDPRDDKQI